MNTDALIDKCATIGKDDHYDVAFMIYQMIMEQNITDYSYKNLSNFCSTTVVNAIAGRSAFWSRESMTNTKMHNLMEIAKCLKTNQYKKIILKELEECFLDKHLEEKV